MCGISLVIHPEKEQVNTILSKLSDSLAHRGPEGSKTKLFQLGNIYLGMGQNLLQTSGSMPLEENYKQPLESVCGRLVMIYNGQIYNRIELLKEETLINYSFRNDTDTEIILALLATQGIGAINKLNGMFAIVLWDKETNYIYAFRDRFGIKSLYYYEKNEVLMIASQAFAVNKIITSKEVNKEGVLHYFQYKYFPIEETVDDKIKSIKPGHLLQIFNGQVIQQVPFVDVQFKLPEERSHLVLRKIKENIINSVREQTDSQQSIALMLSGGIDSSTLAGSLKVLGIEKNIPALTMVYSDGIQKDPDIQYAKKVSETLGQEWTPIHFNNSIIEQLPEYIKTLSLPIADLAGLLTWELSKKQYFEGKILLSGAGADELFLGYNRHHALLYLLEFQKIISFKPIQWISMGISKLFFNKYFNQVDHFINSINAQSVHQSFINMMKDGKYDQYILPNLHKTSFEDPKIAFKDNDYLKYASYLEQNNYLIGDVLTVSDSATMAQGKELRVPYLNNQLREMLVKCNGSQLAELGFKWPLKEMLTDFKLNFVNNRKKKGFGINWGIVFRENAWAKNDLSKLSKSPFLLELWQSNKIESIVSRHLAGKEDFTNAITSMLIYHLWCEEHLA